MDPNSNIGSNYLDRWGREQFGERAVTILSDYYETYFNAPARYGRAEHATAGDEFYQTVGRQILTSSMQSTTEFGYLETAFGRDFSDLAELAGAVLEVCGAADDRWQHAKHLAQEAKRMVPKQRLDFFQASVLTPVDLHLHFNRMMVNLAEMVLASNTVDKIRKLRSAIHEGKLAQASLRAAEYGKWKGFYTAGDWLLDTGELLALARSYLGQMEGHRPPSDDLILMNEDVHRHAYSAYSKITAYQGTRSVEFSVRDTDHQNSDLGRQ